jgi:hypothetical protein
MEFKKIKISPYVANEILIVSSGTGYNENRFSSGMEFDLTKYVKFDAHYLLRDNRVSGDKWLRSNVLGLKLKIAF